MTHYFIGVGGTGARCAEACVYLAAAGIISGDLHFLIIDPDANNGNASAAESLLTYYYLIHGEAQPQNPQFRRGKIRAAFSGAKAPAAVLFQPSINRDGEDPCLWNVQQRNSRHFTDVVKYASCPPKLRSFIDLFYQSNDMNMRLEVGYQGRTNVGAVALKQDLEETKNALGGGLREFLTALVGDLQNGEARVFVAGSVFGGTGAAGIPTLPALLNGLDDRTLPAAQRANLKWGCALMAPYFIFPRNRSAGAERLGPGTDSTRHPVATQAALLHYAQTPPGYQNIYFLGAPHRGQTNEENFPGGNQQKNLPHYAELSAALAAWDFYNLDSKSVHLEARKLHYADSYDNGNDLGVSWETLPVNLAESARKRSLVKQRLITFTTFAYVYRRILHNEFVSNRSYRNSDMYKDNFGGLDMEGYPQEQALVALSSFCENYLEWLSGIGRTGGTSLPVLFNWNALAARQLAQCEQYAGNLIETGAQRAPRYSNNGYQKIMERLNQIRLDTPQTQSAVGLFIYLLHEAVSEFCQENYDLR
ncbi:MAG TPA: hypothetical protein VGO68_05230 [Pyrinomonadaceae bacterium]|jgi:hypothetical protein|nr:hypothetical protein [Pyrinomonadaceae bacterium]